MAKRRRYSGRRKKVNLKNLNWPAIIAAAVLLSAFLVAYLALGQEKMEEIFSRFFEFEEAWSSRENSQPTGGGTFLGDGSAAIHFIDVGQGDCILICSDGKNILIDAGENDQGTVVNAYLDKLHIDQLDLVIGTHPHSDHIGGLDVVLNAHPTEAIILPNIPENKTPTTRTYQDLLEAIDHQNLEITLANPGDCYTFGEGILEILGPVTDQYTDMNDFSVVCRFDYGEVSFLFTGDMETTAEADLLANHADVDADILKLGHHGSSTSTGTAFLRAVSPKICVIELGKGNSYGHPHRETVQKMTEGGYTVYRTDLNGSIVISTDGKDWSIKTEK